MSEDYIDADGNCIHHPQICLRRKRSDGEWRKILSKCPLCAVVPMKRERRKSSVSSRRDDCQQIQRLNSRCRDSCSSSVCSTETSTTVSSMGSSLSSLSRPIDDQSISTTSSPGSSFRSTSTRKKSVVCGMSYVCPETNEHGSYTGQLHLETQLPHGIGTLRLKNGILSDGEWCMGHLLKPSDSSRQRRKSTINSDSPCTGQSSIVGRVVDSGLHFNRQNSLGGSDDSGEHCNRQNSLEGSGGEDERSLDDSFDGKSSSSNCSRSRRSSCSAIHSTSRSSYSATQRTNRRSSYSARESKCTIPSLSRPVSSVSHGTSTSNEGRSYRESKNDLLDDSRYKRRSGLSQVRE